MPCIELIPSQSIVVVMGLAQRLCRRLHEPRALVPQQLSGSCSLELLLPRTSRHAMADVAVEATQLQRALVCELGTFDSHRLGVGLRGSPGFEGELVA